MNRSTHVSTGHLALTFVFLVLLVPTVASGQFASFPDRAAWEASNSTVSLEDFESTSVGAGAVIACGALLLNSTTSETCYGAGDLVAGVDYSIVGLSQFSTLLVAGTGFHSGVVTDMLGPEYDFDALTIDFDPPVESAALSHIQVVTSADFVIVATDTLGATDSTFYAGGTGVRRFYGVSSEHLISRIHFPEINAFEFIDSLAVGAVVLLPDFAIDTLYVTPDISSISPTSLDVVKAHFRIKNIGDATSSLDWRLLKDGSEVDKQSTTDIAPGGVWTDSVSLGTLAASTYAIKIVADPDGSVAESDETNNADSLMLEVKPPPPDLAIQSLYVKPDTSSTSPTTLDEVKAHFQIKNQGDGTVSFLDWTLYLDGAYKGNLEDGPGLAPDQVWTDSVSLGQLSAGFHVVKIVADPSTNIAESDETNNVDTLSFLVKSQLVGVKFAGRVILEGAYTGGGEMSKGLGAAIPLTDPYLATETVSSLPSGVVDWVFVQLRTDSLGIEGSSDQPAFVDSAGAILGADGDTLTFSGLSRIPYYVVINHRNHLSIMTPDTVGVSSDGVMTWDFTASISQAYSDGGSPMKDLGSGIFGMFACDANADGQVTAPDFNIWNASTTAGDTGYRAGDCNLDGQVTAPDFNLWNANTTAGASSQVPD